MEDQVQGQDFRTQRLVRIALHAAGLVITLIAGMAIGASFGFSNCG